MIPSMKTLAFFNGTGWAEDQDFPHADWQQAILDGDTELGYAPWVVARHEEDGLPFVLAQALSAERTDEPPVGLQARFPAQDWLDEVLALDTRLGYAAWVAHRAEAEDEIELAKKDLDWVHATACEAT